MNYSVKSAGKFEDSFYKQSEDFILSGMFDSHGKLGVEEPLKYAKENFIQLFEKNLGQNPSISDCFNNTIKELIQGFKEKKFCTNGLSGLISYVDKKSGLVYTATLGDHEANIYRTMSGSMKSIPLSRPRTWYCKKEMKRGQKWGLKRRVSFCQPVDQKKNELQKELPRPIEESIESLKQESPFSRGIGSLYAGNLVRSKPKITVQKLQKGDLIILASNGLKTVANEQEIIETLKSNGGGQDAAIKALFELSEKKRNKSFAHNVTVMALEVE